MSVRFRRITDQDALVNPWISLLAREGYEVAPPQSRELLAQAQAETIPPWPPSLVSLYEACDGVLDLLAQHWAIWPLRQLVEENRHLRDTNGDFPIEAIAFGDNGCGEPFCVRVDDPGVSCWYPIETEARIVASDMKEFWEAWDSGTLRT